MKYYNTKTQAVIETACVISGGYWIKYEEDKKKTSKTTTSKRKNKKSGEE